MAIDWVVAAVTALSGTFLQVVPPGQETVAPPVNLLIAVWIFLAVALRRRAPVTAYGALIVLAVALAGSSSINPGLIFLVFLAAAYVLYMVTVMSNRQTGAVALVLALTVMVLIVAFDHSARGHGVLLPVALAQVIAWMSGYSMRQRRLYAQTLQHQATSRAVAEERLRIARELHDVVAHSMSVIAVQAGYGQYVIDSSPDDARDALGAIQATSRDALEEMRRMLGVLRQQDAASGAALAAAPAAPDAGTAPAAPAAPEVRGALADPADPVTSLDQTRPRLDRAQRWITTQVPAEQRTRVRDEPDTDLLASLGATERESLRLLLDDLDRHWSLDGLTRLVYGVPKRQAGLPPDVKPTPELKAAQRAFFALLYRLLVGRDTGPRLPTLLLAVGAGRVRKLLDA